jgi:hypothetical protein
MTPLRTWEHIESKKATPEQMRTQFLDMSRISHANAHRWYTSVRIAADFKRIELDEGSLGTPGQCVEIWRCGDNGGAYGECNAAMIRGMIKDVSNDCRVHGIQIRRGTYASYTKLSSVEFGIFGNSLGTHYTDTVTDLRIFRTIGSGESAKNDIYVCAHYTCSEDTDGYILISAIVFGSLLGDIEPQGAMGVTK